MYIVFILSMHELRLNFNR